MITDGQGNSAKGDTLHKDKPPVIRWYELDRYAGARDALFVVGLALIGAGILMLAGPAWALIYFGAALAVLAVLMGK